MIRQYSELLLAKIKEEEDILVDQASSGALDSFDAYKNLCGRIRGLRDARDIIEATQSTFEEDLDERN